VTKSAVSQWEAGATQNIKLKTFLALLEVLGTDYEYLVYGADRAPLPPRGGRRSA
jgi:transcriptional regulator with XRE-family HTH domain